MKIKLGDQVRVYDGRLVGGVSEGEVELIIGDEFVEVCNVIRKNPKYKNIKVHYKQCRVFKNKRYIISKELLEASSGMRNLAGDEVLVKIIKEVEAA